MAELEASAIRKLWQGMAYIPRQRYLFPPLVRAVCTEAEAREDPRWLAWNGVDHLDQDPLERAIARRIRHERAAHRNTEGAAAGELRGE